MKAAQRLLDSRTIVLKSTEVEVMPYIDETLRTINVTNIPREEDVEDILSYVFERIAGAEKVSGIEVERKIDFARITFASAEGICHTMINLNCFMNHKTAYDYSRMIAVFAECHGIN